MANLFEKPIAANPMSDFVALPLQFIDQAIQRKQDKYDQARAAMEATDNDLLSTKALAGDMGRHKEILAEYDAELNKIVENAGGDYGAIGASLDVFKRRLKADMSYGEIGAQHQAYQSALASKDEMDKLYQSGKISIGGLNKVNRAISGYKTTQGEDGSWSRFSGYNPSNIVDPVKHMQDSVDEINAKYDSEGQKNISRNDILTNLSNAISSNSDVLKSLHESYETNPGVNAQGKQQSFEEFYLRSLEAVISDKKYQEVNAATVGKRNNTMMPGTTLENFGQPRTSGNSTYKGGNANVARAGLNAIGVDTTAEHKKWVASEDGKRTISYIESKTGKKFPEGYLAQSRWIKENVNIPKVSPIVLGEVSDDLIKNVVTSDGFFNYSGGIYDQEGNPIDADKKKAIQGKAEGGNTARVIGVIKEGGMYPVGSYVLVGQDGERYIQEPGDPKTLSSQAFNLDQIDSVTRTNTGDLGIKLQGDIIDSMSGNVVIPRGNYQAIHDIKAGGAIKLYQNGVHKYTKITREVDGQMKTQIFKVN